MTEFWKSNAKKFCEICKCWFADNRVSIEFHERGIRHKNAVQIKLQQLGQQSRKKEENDRNLRATLASMEVAALGSFKRDIESKPDLASQYNIQSSVMRIPIRASQDTAGPSKKIQQTFGPTFTPTYGGSSSTTYTVAPSKSASFEKVAIQIANKQTKVPSKKTRSTTEAEAEKVWVEATSPQGDIYYWHMYSGETRWDLPEEGHWLPEEHEAMIRSSEVLEDEAVPAPPLQRAMSGAILNKPFSLDAIKKKLEIVPEDIVTFDDDEVRNDFEEEEHAQEEEVQKVVDDQVELSRGRFVPSAGFSYYTGPAKMEPSSRFVHDNEVEPPMIDVKEAMFAQNDGWKLEDLLRQKRAEEQLRNTAADVQENGVHQVKKPFGQWTIVQQREKPEKVDLELPASDQRSAPEPTIILRPEERVQFVEKTMAVSKKRPKTDMSPVVFKKNNLGAKNLRLRRDQDDE